MADNDKLSAIIYFNVIVLNQLIFFLIANKKNNVDRAWGLKL